MININGKTLPLKKEDFDLNEWFEFTGFLGFAAVELLDVAKAIENKDTSFVNRQDGLAEYYKKLAQNLSATQQMLFGYNVTGDSKITFSK